MMMHYHRRQEELKVRKGWLKNTLMFVLSVPSWPSPGNSFQKLEEADDDSHLDSEWSDRQALRKQFQGLTNIKWGPRWRTPNTLKLLLWPVQLYMQLTTMPYYKPEITSVSVLSEVYLSRCTSEMAMWRRRGLIVRQKRKICHMEADVVINLIYSNLNVFLYQVF